MSLRVGLQGNIDAIQQYFCVPISLSLEAVNSML
jgi:hypothetical protein